MIDYVEIRRKSDREVIGIIDTAKSIIWRSVYYGVGDFEVYVAATPENMAMLVEENYVTRTDNDECGVIEHVEITENSEDGKMIVASGRFVKSILDRRIVYSATLSGSGSDYVWNCSASVLQGNVESAVRKVIYDNAINATGSRPEIGAYRNMPEIYWTDSDITGITDTIVTEDSGGTEESAEKQVTYKNLLEYTDAVLQEYSCGAKMFFDRERLKFRYKVYRGVDRSRDNADNEPIIFSTEFDNLISSNYLTDSTAHKNTALIGGEGDGTERKCAFVFTWAKGADEDAYKYLKGLDRRETFVDASSITSTYKDGDTEKTYDLGVYRQMLETQGRQAIAELKRIETFDGEIDLTHSAFCYGTDYGLGDIVTIEDKDIGKYINARVLTVTEVQDDNGYKIDIEYGI